MKHLFIVNPAAGKKGSADRAAQAAERAFQTRRGEFEIYRTRGPMDAVRKIEREAADVGALRVYACGGDGTLNECVSAAAGRENVAVTQFPCGTGNDFIRCFGEDADLFSHMGLLLEGTARPLDVIRCNDRFSVNICSVGIDARIGTNVHKYSMLPVIGGATGYVVSAVAELVGGIAREMTVSAAGRVFKGEISLVCVCNGSFYGGGFHPVPRARPDDGILEILVVSKVSRLTFLRLIGGYAKGNYRKYSRYISYLRGTQVVIEAPEEFVVNLDGEALYTRRAEMQLIPGGVNFIFPAGMAFFDDSVEKTEENLPARKI